MRNLLMFVSVILLSLPSVAFAAGLVPCGGPGEPECQACYLIQLGNNIIDLLVGIAAVIGAIMFAVAGLKMATSGGNESAVSAAKQSMTNVVIGFVILLAAWLIVDTVMKTFVDQSKFEKAGFGVWNQIQCVDLPMFAREGTAPGGVYDPIGLGGVPSGELDGADAQSQLSVAGVNVISSGRDGNGNYCYDANNSNCTSLTGMRSNTVNQVVNIKTACPSCTVTVTGGTEAGHAGGAYSHSAGYKVDIDDGDPTLNSYLETNLTRNGTRSGSHGGPVYSDSCGNEYVKESSHWDISVTGGACSL